MESGIVSTSTMTMHRSGIIRRCISIIQRHFSEIIMFTMNDPLNEQFSVSLQLRNLNENGRIYGVERSPNALGQFSYRARELNYSNSSIG